MKANSKLILVRDSVSGKGLELARQLLKEGTRVMFNGPDQELIIELLNRMAAEYPACQLYGVPGTIMSVEEFAKFYANPKIDEVVSA